MSELIVTCHLCGQAGFTERGLRSHWCAAKAGQKVDGKGGRNSAPLTKEEWQQGVLIAKGGPFARPCKFDSGVEYTAAGVVEDQLYEIKAMSIPMLRLVVAWKTVGKTVRRAAEVRIRKLEKGTA